MAQNKHNRYTVLTVTDDKQLWVICTMIHGVSASVSSAVEIFRYVRWCGLLGMLRDLAARRDGVTRVLLAAARPAWWWRLLGWSTLDSWSNSCYNGTINTADAGKNVHSSTTKRKAKCIMIKLRSENACCHTVCCHNSQILLSKASTNSGNIQSLQAPSCSTVCTLPRWQWQTDI